MRVNCCQVKGRCRDAHTQAVNLRSGVTRCGCVCVFQREVHGETEQERRAEESGEGGQAVCPLHGNTHTHTARCETYMLAQVGVV